MKKVQRPRSTDWGIAVLVDVLVDGFTFVSFILMQNDFLGWLCVLALCVGMVLAVVYRVLQAKETRETTRITARPAEE
ncbi:MAG TPA: hypothetical protein VFV38_21650 [Ktedonobacteraceae bacterium]|nr:hypothetical protein [Ktedonobacteraceae bacterium]